jgi:hypothetical protein
MVGIVDEATGVAMKGPWPLHPSSPHPQFSLAAVRADRALAAAIAAFTLPRKSMAAERCRSIQQQSIVG